MINSIGSIASTVGSNTTVVSKSAATGATAAADFSSVLGNVANEAMTTLKQSEQVAIDGLHSRANVQQVVDTLLSAERNLQTAIAVRDKLVSAYQEIARMQI